MLDEYLTFLKREEGLRLAPYLDQVGKPTIGYGHLLDSMDHPPLTEVEAEALLRADATKAETAALHLAPNLLHFPKRLAALTDLCYNVGAHAVAGSGTVAAFLREDWKDAAARFVKWDKGGRPLKAIPALTLRRQRLVPWILDGP